MVVLQEAPLPPLLLLDRERTVFAKAPTGNNGPGKPAQRQVPNGDKKGGEVLYVYHLAFSVLLLCDLCFAFVYYHCLTVDLSVRH
jgi:hypothetical protein